MKGKMMESIVITGATSMLGIALIEAALKETEIKRIYAVVRENSQKLNRIPKDGRINIVFCNIENYESLREKINGTADAFYHLAWQLTGKQRNTDIYRQAENIGYALRAVRAASELRCKKFIGIGSQAEYGETDLVKLSPDVAANPSDAYGIAKYCAGKLVRKEAEGLGMDCFWIRVFSVYGKYDHPSTMVASTVGRLLQGESPVFTPAENMWDFLESRDAGRALLLVGQKACGNKIYCLGSGQARPLKEYIKIIGNIVNPDIKLRIGDIPYPDGKGKNICADISGLTEDTGWKPEISFEEGIGYVTFFLTN